MTCDLTETSSGPPHSGGEMQRNPAHVAEFAAALPEYPAVVEIVAQAMTEMASAKNVPLTNAHAFVLAAAVSKSLPSSALPGLLCSEPKAVAVAASVINRMVDVVAGMRVIASIWEAQGFEELEVDQFANKSQQWVSYGPANDAGDKQFRWPDLSELRSLHYRSLGCWPVAIRYPANRPARAAYSYDIGPRHVADYGSTWRIPPMIRCEGLPYTHRETMPNGRSYRRLTIDAYTESWWQDGKRHRDSKVGPAFHHFNAGDGRIEYHEHGHLHRDASEGPAITDTNLDGTGIRSEEYFLNDQFHRPSVEGPAVVHTDASGRRILEIYAEHGLSHRDPSQGPAWHTVEDGEERWEYRVQGMWHRDEREGAALYARDCASGTLKREEYYFEGKEHRTSGPSRIERDQNGTVVFECWARHGEFHRDPSDGPALIFRDAAGNVTTAEYYFDGVEVDASGARISDAGTCDV